QTQHRQDQPPGVQEGKVVQAVGGVLVIMKIEEVVLQHGREQADGGQQTGQEGQRQQGEQQATGGGRMQLEQAAAQQRIDQPQHGEEQQPGAQPDRDEGAGDLQQV